MTILPLAYLPSVEYIAHLLREECVIDLGEHFIKRSERNRTRILATGAPWSSPSTSATPTARASPCARCGSTTRSAGPTSTGSRSSRPTAARPTSTTTPSASNPSTAHRATCLRSSTLRCCARCSRRPRPLPAPPLGALRRGAAGDVDLRPKHREGPAFEAEPYIQVFSDRMPFVANLSFIDLLFAEGPQAAAVAARSRF